MYKGLKQMNLGCCESRDVLMRLTKFVMNVSSIYMLMNQQKDDSLDAYQAT